MPLELEPDAQREVDLIAEHRPESLKTFLDIVPSEWWITAIRSKQSFESSSLAAQSFVSHYYNACKSMTFSHNWFSSKAWTWHDFLAPFKTGNVDVLEVGVFEGRSVVFCLEYLPESTIVAVDHFVIRKGWTSSQGKTLELDSEEAVDRNVAPYGSRVEKINNSSWKALSSLI